MIFLSLAAAVLTLIVLALGLSWGFRLVPEQLWLRQTALSWHWMLALALVLPFALHAWRRWPRPRRADFLSRRAALHLFGLGAVAGLAWWISAIFAEKRAPPDSPDRFTGSRLAASDSGNRFPVTHSVAATASQVDPKQWRLTLEGAVYNRRILTFQQLQTFPTGTIRAALDCTLGWYSVQEWSGIPLSALFEDSGLPAQAFAVRFESVTGYANILPLDEATKVLLATHVGDESLDHLHGFPLRAVVPTRRGWFWVKWLTRIEVIGF
jgi:DMSO/TMAO reductase YedYZ molybdopterin-dependent catalytic subunit